MQYLNMICTYFLQPPGNPNSYMMMNDNSVCEVQQISGSPPQQSGFSNFTITSPVHQVMTPFPAGSNDVNNLQVAPAVPCSPPQDQATQQFNYITNSFSMGAFNTIPPKQLGNVRAQHFLHFQCIHSSVYSRKGHGGILPSFSKISHNIFIERVPKCT